MSDLKHVKGLRDLDRKLSALGNKLGGKALRQATMNATTPAYKAMKAAAPRGKKPHRTYKGRLVAPGFLSRSIKRKSSFKRGKARAVIGVLKEAFYGLTFVEKGTKPHVIPKSKKKRFVAFGGRVFSSIKHPGARAQPWFEKSFIKKRKAMTDRLADQLVKKIDRIRK